MAAEIIKPRTRSGLQLPEGSVDPRNYVGDPNAGEFIDWDSTFLEKGYAPPAEANEHGTPSVWRGQATGFGKTVEDKIGKAGVVRAASAPVSPPAAETPMSAPQPQGQQAAAPRMPTPAMASPVPDGNGARPMPFAAQLAPLFAARQGQPQPQNATASVPYDPQLHGHISKGDESAVGAFGAGHSRPAVVTESSEEDDEEKPEVEKGWGGVFKSLEAIIAHADATMAKAKKDSGQLSLFGDSGGGGSKPKAKPKASQGGWQRGPRGGMRRRSGNGWEYKKDGAEGGKGGGGDSSSEASGLDAAKAKRFAENLGDSAMSIVEKNQNHPHKAIEDFRQRAEKMSAKVIDKGDKKAGQAFALHISGTIRKLTEKVADGAGVQSDTARALGRILHAAGKKVYRHHTGLSANTTFDQSVKITEATRAAKQGDKKKTSAATDASVSESGAGRRTAYMAAEHGDLDTLFPDRGDDHPRAADMKAIGDNFARAMSGKGEKGYGMQQVFDEKGAAGLKRKLYEIEHPRKLTALEVNAVMNYADKKATHKPRGSSKPKKTKKSMEHSMDHEHDLSGRILAKGLHGFHGSPQDKDLPDDLLYDYLVAFVEEASEHERRQHTAADLKAEDQLQKMARAVMNELVAYVPTNKNLLRACKKHKCTVETVKELLVRHGLFRPAADSDWTSDADSHRAMGGYAGEDAMAYSMTSAMLERDPAGRPGVAMAPPPVEDVSHLLKAETPVDPFEAVRARAQARTAALWQHHSDAPVRATIDASCPVHGGRDISKAQQVSNPMTPCTCHGARN